MNKLTKGLLVASLLASPLVGAETQYPPPFNPTVVYQDKELINKYGSSQTAAPSAPAASSSSAAAEPAKSAANADDLSHNYIMGAFLLGLIGLMIWGSRQPKAAASAATAVVAQVKAVAGSAGETGVAKYMKSIGAGAETGVAKYLKTVSSNVSSVASSVVSETGVAKYLKSVDISAKGSAAATGVAKYLRDRGN